MPDPPKQSQLRRERPEDTDWQSQSSGQSNDQSVASEHKEREWALNEVWREKKSKKSYFDRSPDNLFAEETCSEWMFAQ